MDKLLEVLDKLGPFLYVAVPTAFGIYYEVKKRVSKKKEEIIREDKRRAKEAYNVWEHEESKRVIERIKAQCNLFKDRGHVDLVQYLQLENGTMATSKIQNMFVTCLAEDDRYGVLPKLIKKMQRVPYSEFIGWIDKFVESDEPISKQVYKVPDLSKVSYSTAYVGELTQTHSTMIAPVYDPNAILLGIVVFDYQELNYNGHEESELDNLHDFKTAIELILLEYHVHRREKKKDLMIEDEV